MKIKLRTIYAERKVNLCYKALKVVIVIENEQGDMETISLKIALNHYRHGVEVSEGDGFEAGLLTADSYRAAIHRIAHGKPVGWRPRTSASDNWLVKLSQWTDAYSVKWNKAGIKL